MPNVVSQCQTKIKVVGRTRICTDRRTGRVIPINLPELRSRGYNNGNYQKVELGITNFIKKTADKYLGIIFAVAFEIVYSKKPSSCVNEEHLIFIPVFDAIRHHFQRVHYCLTYSNSKPYSKQSTSTYIANLLKSRLYLLHV